MVQYEHALIIIYSLWGIIAMSTAAATTFVGLFMARFAMGIAEAGFLPGSAYVIIAFFIDKKKYSCVTKDPALYYKTDFFLLLLLFSQKDMCYQSGIPVKN